jgi:proline iminopeptidase
LRVCADRDRTFRRRVHLVAEDSSRGPKRARRQGRYPVRVRLRNTELYVDVTGSQLRVGDARLVEYPTVVVLHGGPGFDQGHLRPGLDPLAAVAQVVFVDLRGQGRYAPVPAETCTLERMADDVAELCDLLGVAAPVVFGHSAGGFVALHLALRHPGRVGGLILCDSAPTLAPLPDEDPPPSLAQRAPAESMQVAGRLFGGDFSSDSLDAFNRVVFPYYAGPTHSDVPGRIMALSNLNAEIAGHFFGRQAGSYDVRSRLGEIATPTLVVVGRYDWVCPPAASRVLAAAIAGAHLVEIDDAGHFPFSEEPDAFQAAVLPFLADVGSAGAPGGAVGHGTGGSPTTPR